MYMLQWSTFYNRSFGDLAYFHVPLLSPDSTLDVSKSYSHFLSITITIFNDQRFSDTLTNEIDSFEQLGPGVQVHIATIGKNLRKCAIIFFFSINLLIYPKRLDDK